MNTTIMNTEENGSIVPINHKAYYEERNQFTFQKQKTNKSIINSTNDMNKKKYELFKNTEEAQSPCPFNPENVVSVDVQRPQPNEPNVETSVYEDNRFVQDA